MKNIPLYFLAQERAQEDAAQRIARLNAYEEAQAAKAKAEAEAEAEAQAQAQAQDQFPFSFSNPNIFSDFVNKQVKKN